MRDTLIVLLEMCQKAAAFDEDHIARAKPAELLTPGADLEARAAVLRGLAAERQHFGPPRTCRDGTGVFAIGLRSRLFTVPA